MCPVVSFDHGVRAAVCAYCGDAAYADCVCRRVEVTMQRVMTLNQVLVDCFARQGLHPAEAPAQIGTCERAELRCGKAARHAEDHSSPCKQLRHSCCADAGEGCSAPVRCYLQNLGTENIMATA